MSWRLSAKLVALTLACAVLAIVAIAVSRTGLYAPAPTLMLLDRSGRFLGEIGAADDERLGFWPIEELPPRVIATTVAVEDQRFYRHPGVDPLAIVRALRQNIEAGQRISGASTIAMQLARLQHPGSRTYLRKATEAITALLLVPVYGREAVLRQYLTLAPYGNNVHGIGYAARRYFDKPVEDLSWAQTALLCALPQAPSLMNPYTTEGRERAVERATRILSVLHERHRMTDNVFEQALAELELIHIPDRPVRPPETLHAVLQWEKELREDQLREPFAGDPIIRTTIDLELQERVQNVLWRFVQRWKSRGAGNASAVVIERIEGSGGVRFNMRARVGSTDWFDSTTAGSIDYSRVPRHPGSALKPFIYASALDSGEINSATVLDDLTCGPDGIGNADRRFLGPMLPRQALGNSRNVPAVALTRRLGLSRVYALYHELGLRDDRLPVEHYGLGLALGGMPVRLTDLVRAYTALAEDGLLHEIRWHEAQPRRPPHRIFKASTARIVSRYLADPMARLPSFPRMGYTEYPFAVAVKTGTSADYRDAWTIAYSRKYIVGVWLGHPDWTPMKQLAGYTGASKIARHILLPLHGEERDGLNDAAWPAPNGYVERDICTLSGALATPACSNVSREHFSAERAPVDSCTIHRHIAVDVQTGEIANGSTRGDRVEVRTFLDLPERYAEWAKKESLPVLPRAKLEVRDAESSHVAIISPEDGICVVADPESPGQFSSLALHGIIDPPVPQATWYVDGEPFALVEYPYSTRWPVQPGEHQFELRVPFVASARSSPVRVLAR